MKFGDNLRKLRKLRKLSQEDLAEKIGVSRQSVSKWETGDAYPEMSNILELCKIFHCHINDLVNDSIIDIGSLDEEIKISVVKFKKEKQSKMKGLSKSIYVIAKILRIFSMVFIPIVVVSMIILGIVASKIDIRDNEIVWDGNNNIFTLETDGKVSLKIGDNLVVAEISNQNEINKIKEAFQNNSKVMIVSYVEVGMLFLVISLVLITMMLKYLENLFDNINKEGSPFTLENVGYIKRIAYLMIVVTILPSVIGAIFEVLLKMDLDIGFEMFNLVEILFLFSISYIFEYGYEIQLDSKGKMYGDENE